MCDVCVAESAIHAASCGDKKCKAFMDGDKIHFFGAPKIDSDLHPFFKTNRTKIKAMARAAGKTFRPRKRWKGVKRYMPAPAICIRAKGKAEGPAIYQLRLDGEDWPKEWLRTKCLADIIVEYGLDCNWSGVPKIVKEWVLCKRRMPTREQVEATKPKVKIDMKTPVIIKFDEKKHKVFYASLKRAGFIGKSAKG